MSYDITGSVSESCTAYQNTTVSGTLSYPCSSVGSADVQGSISWGCRSFGSADVQGSISWSCSSFSSTDQSGSISWSCNVFTTATIVAQDESSSYVFEEGRAVQTGRPRANDFVYIRDPKTGDDELVSTFLEDSILTFIDNREDGPRGVVSLPPSDGS